MANVRENTEFVTPQKEVFFGSPLDTLAQLDHGLPKTPVIPTKTEKLGVIETLKKRAISKYYTVEILHPLIDLKNERQNSYWNTWHCVNILMQKNDGSITAKYCKNRWCIVCNRIRTGIYINTLAPEMKKWKNRKFVTLTTHLTKTCFTEQDLKAAIHVMQSVFEKIWRRLKRKFGTINAVRKLEVTYNSNTKHFHPHYHIILENNSEEANYLVLQWLTEFKQSSADAQDIRNSTEGDVIELFKYFTKMWKKITSEETYEEKRVLPYPPQAMDTIFAVMQGKRTIQKYGINHIKITDDFDELQALLVTDERRTEMWNWEQDLKNWVNYDTGELRI